MLLHQTLEYLFYLALFILMCKYAAAAPQQTQQLVDQHYEDNAELPTPSSTSPQTPPVTMRQTALDECQSTFSWMCMKIEFIKIVERLAEKRELNIMPGISVVKDEHAAELRATDLMATVARNYPNDPSSRLNGYILAKLENLLQTRFLRFKLIDEESVTEARAAVAATGRKGKFGKKGGLEALIAAGVMMKGTLLAIGMGALALIAGKALMTALMALTLSGVLGLKSLAGGGGKSTTYEIVAKPIYTSSHSHSVSHEDAHAHGGHYGGGMTGGHSSGSGYGGYGRSLNLDLPANVQKTR